MVVKKHELHYCDIGDYLSRNDKLNKVKNNKSIFGFEWELIEPDHFDDWINQKDVNYNSYRALADEPDSYFYYKR